MKKNSMILSGLFIVASYFILTTHAINGLSVFDNNVTPPRDEALKIRVLSNHKVVYSKPHLDTTYKSNSMFNARGMHYVYFISHTFLDLIQRKDILPPGINESVIFQTSPKQIPQLLEKHWQDILIQYIGVVTFAICGILLAIAMPIAGLCLCCCRCGGKCGARIEHYDKKSDSCKRFCTGVILATFIIISMFGVVCVFVTSFYTYNGIKNLPERLDTSTEDTSLYLENTNRQIKSLFVTNFAELEEVLSDVLDESGPILKKSLADITQAAAIDDLTDIVSNLGNVRRYLRDIQNKTYILQDKVGQLGLGLNDTSLKILRALQNCGINPSCANFLKEYNIKDDLTIASTFGKLPQNLPDLSLLMKDISDLMNNDIERKVRGGQKQLDKVKVDIERSIEDIRPKIKDEIRRMGAELEEQALYINNLLNKADRHVLQVQKQIPEINPFLEQYSLQLLYIGLGLSFMVFIILICYVMGLFYGFCGKRPGNSYGDDCCNTGTAANWLLSAIYLTFFFSCVLLLVTTAQFLIGSTVERVACESAKNPNESKIFQYVDENYLQPMLKANSPRKELGDLSFNQLISECHKNKTAYDILMVDSIYNINDLRNWRKEYGISDFIDNLKRKIRLNDLRGIQILSPEAERELKELSESQISDLNFSQYTKLLKEKITSIDLTIFTSRLRSVRERLTRQQSRIVGPTIDNQILFLEQMQRVVMDMKLAMKDLVNSVNALEAEARLAKPNLRQALVELINQATKATAFLRREGPELIEELTDQYVNETMGLIDHYVEHVINHTKNTVGSCEPLSVSYNATVIAVCNEIVDPFNGVWTSVGWCLLFFIVSISLALSLSSLYKISEPYPGPLVEAESATRSEQSQHSKKKRRGHRRNPSEYLPDSAHYRAGYSYQHRGNRSHDVSAPQIATSATPSSSIPNNGPPRYSSNPRLNEQGPSAPKEYERPPPYCYPGSAPPPGEAPPPLPAPNRT